MDSKNENLNNGLTFIWGTGGQPVTSVVFPVSFNRAYCVVGGVGPWIDQVAGCQITLTNTGWSSVCYVRTCWLNGGWIAIGKI